MFSKAEISLILFWLCRGHCSPFPVPPHVNFEFLIFQVKSIKMKTFTRPKIFRSTEGCCICKAKSSSSRFTDSEKYEDDFQKCFQLAEERQGEICNACVLIGETHSCSLNFNWVHILSEKMEEVAQEQQEELESYCWCQSWTRKQRFQ